MTTRHWIITGIFTIIAGIFAFGTLATLSAPAEAELAAPPSSAAEADTAARPPLIAYDPLSMEAFPAVFDRPLFSQDRLPFPGDEAGAFKTASAAGQCNGRFDAKLIGVVIAGDASFALLDSPGKDKPVRMRPGQQYKGWRLQSVR